MQVSTPMFGRIPAFMSLEMAGNPCPILHSISGVTVAVTPALAIIRISSSLRRLQSQLEQMHKPGVDLGADTEGEVGHPVTDDGCLADVVSEHGGLRCDLPQQGQRSDAHRLEDVQVGRLDLGGRSV